MFLYMAKAAKKDVQVYLETVLWNYPRFMRAGYFVMPPVANANYAQILHMLSKLDVNHGVAGFMLANGAMNIGDAEGTLRKKILERERVEAIIVLPRDMFYNISNLKCLQNWLLQIIFDI